MDGWMDGWGGGRTVGCWDTEARLLLMKVEYGSIAFLYIFAKIRMLGYHTVSRPWAGSLSMGGHNN